MSVCVVERRRTSHRELYLFVSTIALFFDELILDATVTKTKTREVF